MQHRLSILVGRLEVVNRANPLNDFNGRFNLVYDLSHTLIGHGGFIQGIGNNTGRIDSFHLLLKLFHRESLKRRMTAHETTGAMRSGAVPLFISLANADVGNRLTRLELTQGRLTEQFTNVTESKSANEDIDLEDVVVSYTSAQLVYNASLQAASKVVQQTLLDFLG